VVLACLHDFFVVVLCTGANKGVLEIGGHKECVPGHWPFRGMRALV
jgi:hypothetical protein